MDFNCILPTGRPKGVQVSHTALADYLAWYRKHYKVTHSDIGLMYLSINFDAHLLQLLPTMTAGGQLVLAAQGRHLDYQYMADLLHRYNVTLLSAPISLLTQYLAALAAAKMTPSSLRSATVGGEALPPLLVQQFYKLLPDAQLHNEYGPTEATIGATIMMCSPDMQRITIGRPHSNAHCYVVDSQLQLVPPGVPGELLLSGPGLAIGYVGRPEMTADR
jgi:non-ribosomal peptide synthetase component F